MGNKHLNFAQKQKFDEFYTQYVDIEKELSLYKDQFRDTIVYSNCDNPIMSQFYQFFIRNFDEYGLKKYICTYYNPNGVAEKWCRERGDETIHKTKLMGNGDFRSNECKNIMSQCDIVVTNPPFSIASQLFDIIFKLDKKFLIVCNQLIIKHRVCKHYVINERLTLGYNNFKNSVFLMSENHINIRTGKPQQTSRLGCVYWLTNLVVFNKPKIEPTETWTVKDGRVFGSDGCEIHRSNTQLIYYINNINSIPKNIKEVEKAIGHQIMIGVPVSYFYKHNPDIFEIVDIINSPRVNNKYLFSRIIIRMK